MFAQTTFYSQDFEISNDWTITQPGYSNNQNFWVYGTGTAGATTGAATYSGSRSIQIWRYQNAGGGSFSADYNGSSTGGYTRILER